MNTISIILNYFIYQIVFILPWLLGAVIGLVLIQYIVYKTAKISLYNKIKDNFLKEVI